MKTNKNRITSPLGLRICLYVMLLAFGACSSCKKDQPPPDPVSTLPPPTQTGANTFGAMVDGVPYIPTGTGGFGGTKPTEGGYIGSSIGIPKYTVHIRTYLGRNALDLYVKSVTASGRYPLSFDTGTFGTSFPKNYGLYSINGAILTDPDYNYITTSQVTGFVDFTVADTVTTQLSGTFEFEGIDFPSGKKTKITNGRFDINQTKRR